MTAFLSFLIRAVNRLVCLAVPHSSEDVGDRCEWCGWVNPWPDAS